MKKLYNKQQSRFVGAVFFALLVCLGSTVSAQTTTVTYDLDNVWLLPDLSHPWEGEQQMTGSFQWTYLPGDFENGSGQMIDLYVPWYGTDFQALEIIFDLTSLEFVLPGSYHDLGLDLTLFLLQPLSTDQPVVIDTDRSIFEIQQGISRRGHVISGSIVPRTGLTVSAALTCLPASGTVPFTMQMTVTLDNLYPDQSRQIAARMNLTLAGGAAYPNWRAGYTNVAAGERYTTAWNQNIPALGSLIGDNVFSLVVEDVTPAPYNQPPYPASGDTAVASCTVTGAAP